MDLGPAGESWQDRQAQVRIGRLIDWQERARTDEGHVATQDVVELRQFIESAQT